MSQRVAANVLQCRESCRAYGEPPTCCHTLTPALQLARTVVRTRKHREQAQTASLALKLATSRSQAPGPSRGRCVRCRLRPFPLREGCRTDHKHQQLIMHGERASSSAAMCHDISRPAPGRCDQITQVLPAYSDRSHRCPAPLRAPSVTSLQLTHPRTLPSLCASTVPVARRLTFGNEMQAARRRFAQPMRPQTSAAAALLVLLLSAELAGADDTAQPSLRDRSQLSPASSPVGLANDHAAGLMPAEGGHGSAESLPRGNRSINRSIAHGNLSSVDHAGSGFGKRSRPGGGRETSSAAWPDGFSTASMQQPISFPDGWLAQQASNLLAFSLQALEYQAAEEQVRSQYDRRGSPAPATYHVVFQTTRHITSDHGSIFVFLPVGRRKMGSDRCSVEGILTVAADGFVAL